MKRESHGDSLSRLGVAISATTEAHHSLGARSPVSQRSDLKRIVHRGLMRSHFAASSEPQAYGHGADRRNIFLDRRDDEVASR
jgi:hypothetical protein